MLVLFSLFILSTSFLVFYCVKLHKRIQTLERSFLSSVKLLTNVAALAESNSTAIRGLTTVTSSLNESYGELEVSMINFSEEIITLVEQFANKVSDREIPKIKLN